MSQTQAQIDATAAEKLELLEQYKLPKMSTRKQQLVVQNETKKRAYLGETKIRQSLSVYSVLYYSFNYHNHQIL